MLKVFLPPNLSASAPRDAIAVKVELDLSRQPSVELFPVLAKLQAICGGTAQPPTFMQLTRRQLRELVQAGSGQPLFRWINAPDKNILWIGPRLRGVSEFLDEPETEKATQAKPSPKVEPTPSRPRYEAEPASPMVIDGSEHYLAVTLPSREHSAYQASLELVKSEGFVLEPANRKWWLRDRHKTLNFLARNLDRLNSEFFADFTPGFESRTSHLSTARIQCDVTKVGGEFSVTLGLDAERLTVDSLRNAISVNRNYAENNSGQIILLPPAQLERLEKVQRALAGEDPGLGGFTPTTVNRTHRIRAARIPEVNELIEDIAPGTQPPSEWKRRAEALKNLTQLPPAPLPAAFAVTLRPYQQLGVAWLWHLYKNQLGAILADEMGLGKTAQALAFLSALYRPEPLVRDGSVSKSLRPPRPADRPSLVVCPASLVENWRREAARFAPFLRVQIHHGTTRAKDLSQFRDCDLILTSYGTLARDQDLFYDLKLACLIGDEAQHAKNRRTQNARALRSLDATGRFFLTGTPIENSVDDLRSLFEILMPGSVEPLPAGLKSEEKAWHEERLHARTAPYILRRTKQAVAPELPDKIEQILYCEPTAGQNALYREWQERTERELMDLEASGANDGRMRMATLTQLLRLRQICCDPRLVDAARPASQSTKLDAFKELLAEAIDDGHRLLVFSQFTSLLALIREELESQDISFCQLDGSMSTKQRQAQVDLFNQDDSIPVFLLSLKAGGTGLNLTAADTVVHLDPWWNPAAEAQATDRAHRIGQTKVVTSYKLICTGTVEEKVLALQDNKRALLADVFEASDAANAKLSLTDLRDLLRNA